MCTGEVRKDLNGDSAAASTFSFLSITQDRQTLSKVNGEWIEKLWACPTTREQTKSPKSCKTSLEMKKETLEGRCA